jgi:hypothetical protein
MHRIPIQAVRCAAAVWIAAVDPNLWDVLIVQLAANGPSVVTKIRVVAVTLLDALPAADYGDANVQGIAAYLLGEHMLVLQDAALIIRLLEYHDEH